MRRARLARVRRKAVLGKRSLAYVVCSRTLQSGRATELGIGEMRFGHYPHSQLSKALLEAYSPCRHFGTCPQAVWNTKRGHIPRGFLGAIGRLSRVEIVMVFSEPGHPYDGEGFHPDMTPNALLQSAVRRTYNHHRAGTDPFHRNVRWFLRRLYPDMTFDAQLQRAWLTEGRLCSIEKETGSVRDMRCARHYLARQIEMLPNALIVAFGGKAQRYVKNLDLDFLSAYALAPPGANHKPARPSWERAIEAIRKRRQTRRDASGRSDRGCGSVPPAHG